MKDHPLPQNVTSYQFHLVGSMTLKQFFLLAGGVGVTWIFWALPINALFKWPLMFLSAGIGVAFAFLPYQDRPLDQWLINFLKAIYGPTKYIWKKHPVLPEFMTSSVKPPPPPPPKPRASAKKPLENYLDQLPTNGESTSVDVTEEKRLFSIRGLFTTTSPSLPPSPIPLEPYPSQSLKVRVRSLKTPPPDYAAPQPLIKPSPLKPQPRLVDSERVALTSLSTPRPQEAPQQATVNTRLPFPSIPPAPNLIVGMTLDPKRNILEGAIIEIRNQKGHPVRALKSNKLGQFFTATPLPKGTYEIETEKPGYRFNLVSLNLNDTIVPPIELRAQEPTASRITGASPAASASANPRV